MEGAFISYYLRFFESLSIQSKLEVLAKMMESLKSSYPPSPPLDKEELLDKLTGAWADIDDSVEEAIYSSRTISDRTLDFN